MKEILFIQSKEQIKAIWETTRYPMINLLINKPMTGAQLARELNIPRTRAHYHLKILVHTGLVEFQEEKVKDGMVEKYYRAIARNFRIPSKDLHGSDTLDPALNDQTRGELYRDIILTIIEQIRADVTVPDIDIATFYHLGLGTFQNASLLTDEQIITVKKKINDLFEIMNHFEKENMDIEDKHKLTPFRVTTIQTPVSHIYFDIPEFSKENET
ncbi:MAG: winged helix-turn-helix transcriptional regulator [Anaerolineaceae bacterium]|nr:winged helix-turn-helix transcriptional regulator [Anaerolineaceae bacterium]